MVVSTNGRRASLGPRASAALPRIWKALVRAGLSHTAFAERVGLTTGGASKLLYGDVDPTSDVIRRVAKALTKTRSRKAFVRELGTWVLLWNAPCPPSWRPHAYPGLKRDELAATGTD